MPVFNEVLFHLQLYAEDDDYTSAICTFTRSLDSTDDTQRGAGTAKLELTPRASAIQELVVISCLFLEKQRRHRPQIRSAGLGSWVAGGITALFPS